MIHKVYRLFDESGNLLYVGVTSSVAARFAAHEEEKAWWHEVAQVEVESHEKRDDALRAEMVAIHEENPVYNKARTMPPSLIRLPPPSERDGLDLVGPAEIAERLGVLHSTVHTWRYRKVLPDPLAVISGVPIWEWDTIKEWNQGRKA